MSRLQEMEKVTFLREGRTPNGLSGVLSGLAAILFPERCPVCEEVLAPGKKEVCPKCRKLLHPAKGDICIVCGAPMLEPRGAFSYRKVPETGLCRDCERRQGKHAFIANRSLYYYGEALRAPLYRFKYSNKQNYGRIFAAEAARQWGPFWKKLGVECVLHLPMTEKKKKLRGYDQAQVLAEALAKECGLPYCPNALVRKRDTAAMKKLNPEKRRQNLKNAFHITKSALQWNTVLLVDDIYTTGATMDVAAKCLTRAGVREVYGFTIAVGQAV